jgi:hypothetical protein
MGGKTSSLESTLERVFFSLPEFTPERAPSHQRREKNAA